MKSKIHKNINVTNTRFCKTRKEITRLFMTLLLFTLCFAVQAQATKTKTTTKKTTTKKVVKAKTPKKASKVYVCDGGVNSYVYHVSRNCSNMKKRNNNKVLEVSIPEATGTFNRKPCKICAK